MKLKLIFIALFALFLTDCKDKEEADPDVKTEVTDSVVFANPGDFTFEIALSDITATISITGAGGGGAGGGILNSGTNSTGGGGGGGSGEVKLLKNITLLQDTVYSVKVGSAGSGGNTGVAGGNGLSSEILLNTDVLFSATGGNGGLSNAPNSKTGGVGGTGFVDGRKGGNGENADVFTLDADPGSGGIGGVNISNNGNGGNGGIGTRIVNLNPVAPQPGNKGGDGFIKIVWTGLQ
jgi:hypothetical protein